MPCSCKTVLFPAMLLMSGMFLSGCGEDGGPTEKATAVSEYDLSTGKKSYLDENHMAVLSLEPKGAAGERHDLDIGGRDCFRIKTTKDLDDIFLRTDSRLPIRSISITDMQNGSTATFLKDDTNSTCSFKAGRLYRYCIERNDSGGKNQVLFIAFGRDPDRNSGKARYDQSSINMLETSGSCTGIKCDLTYANLTGMQLQDANLSGARLDHATLYGADLSHADLTGTHLASVDIENTVLDHTTIDHRGFSFTSIENASFVGSKIIYFPFPEHATDSRYSGIDFSHADLSRTHMQSITFDDCDFHRANFNDALLNGSSFDSMNLAGAVFTGADMGDTTYRGADLSNATWTDGRQCLEGSIGECIRKSDKEFYHFSHHFKIDGWTGTRTQGGGITVGDTDNDGKANLITFWIDNPEGDNHAYYKVSSNIGADGSVDRWTKYSIPGWVGTGSAGGGITTGDTDGNGNPNLVVFWIDDPAGSNHGHYKISSDINADGSVDRWSEHYIPGWFGDSTEGGGITVEDTDGNGKPNLVVFWIDNPSGENHGYYKVSSDIKPDGSVESWTEHRIPGWFGDFTGGGGIAAGDIDNDGKPNLIAYWIDNPSGDNHAYYRVSSNIKKDGSADSWTKYHITESFYKSTEGGGIAVKDFDGSGHPNLFVYYIDNFSGANSAYYRIGYFNNLR